MTVVLDTNVLIQAPNPRNPYATIMTGWYAGHFVRAIPTDILLESQEVIVRQSGNHRWVVLENLLRLAVLYRENIVHMAPSFFFTTNSADRDDDKFADCAIAAHADWIVTDDSHFNPLIGSGFKPQPIRPADFMVRLSLNSPT